MKKANKVSRREFIKTSAAVSLAASHTVPSALFAGEQAKDKLKSKDVGKLTTRKECPNISFRRTIPVRYEVDVFVAGGGPAGVSAAFAAACQGCRVYVAEGHSCFGGMGTAARVPTFMQFTDGVNFLAAGIGEKIYGRLQKEAPNMYGNSIHTEPLKRVYDDLMIEAGVSFTFHTHLIGAEARNGRVTYAICSAKSGIFAVKAKTFVDGTGNGDLAAWAGAPFEKGDKNDNLMPGTLCSLWSNIDWETVYANRTNISNPDGQMLERAFADGIFTFEDWHLTGMFRHGEHLGGGNIGHIFGVDGTDEHSLTKALLWGRKGLKEYERYYKKYLKGFEKMVLAATGSLLGVRETRRIMGDYVLGLEDFKRRAIFDDEIGRYCFPVDIHPHIPGKEAYDRHRKQFDQTMRLGKGESYGIPYRILTPRGLDNVLVAGRCVSCDRYVHGSIRVMPGCYITGQAAGVAAAMAAEKNTATRNLDIRELQKRLKGMGAFLPNS